MPFLFIFFILFSFNFSMNAYPLSKKNMESLIGPDYGVLTDDDLFIANQNCIPPIPHYNPTSGGTCYRYWQCFPAKNVTLKCRSWFDSTEKEWHADANIRIDTNTEHHAYGFRHAWDRKVCADYLKTWKKLSKNQNFICLLGEPVGTENENLNGNQIPVTGWVWDMLKTKKGCRSWFKDCKNEDP